MEIGTEADWSKRGDYIAKHAMTPTFANEALSDPNRVVLEPDPSSISGESVRVIGYSTGAATLVTVIVLPKRRLWGVNAWPSNPTDRRKYQEA